ncbi:MAG: RnfH family protein [Nitrosomonas sp.]|jgi:putative ubiquitin-RnfH superfamily antitoxin RatB of RatAB toxin-antitoxin module|nr:RnfH family protein [Nitrosomonas sp.]MBP9870062.1 RnfH family protein [Nitrosomonas sp.]MDO8334743.1 RnfH family protein [Nitrosomonas sp.]
MANHDNFSIEIAYARSHVQTLKTLEVSSGCTVKEAIILSGIMDQFPEIDLTKNKIGIFSKFIQPDTLVQPKDRIEIYRPLIIDPKDARRLRAKRI